MKIMEHTRYLKKCVFYRVNGYFVDQTSFHLPCIIILPVSFDKMLTITYFLLQMNDIRNEVQINDYFLSKVSQLSSAEDPKA